MTVERVATELFSVFNVTSVDVVRLNPLSSVLLATIEAPEPPAHVWLAMSVVVPSVCWRPDWLLIPNEPTERGFVPNT